jgi:hypothetical protein
MPQTPSLEMIVYTALYHTFDLPMIFRGEAIALLKPP